ncbi:MAG: N-succinylarginine dihydrolase [Pirellula sp.]
MPSPWIECNVDGLIGPTHHYGGLGVGNLASHSNRLKVSNPRAAALQGLSKMCLVAKKSVPQFFLPPPKRPNWEWLESCGFGGSRQDVLHRCYDVAPVLLSAAYSSAFMWTANAATVAPSIDTVDSKLHVVPANLCSSIHRGQEASERASQLKSLLINVPDTRVHAPLPSVLPLRDEGAANHMRFCCPETGLGIHLFVYGPPIEATPSGGFHGRQSELASKQVANALALHESDVVFAQQSAEAIAEGVFHNDVIAMSHGSLFIVHERAFARLDSVLEELAERFQAKTGQPLRTLRVSEGELPVHEAVRTYLFNSQLIEDSLGQLELICPEECIHSDSTRMLIQGWIDDPSNPIQRATQVPLNQSMANGGGPACLRLRIPLHREQIAAMGDEFRINEAFAERLREAIEKWYPESLSIEDLNRLEFAEHVHRAVDALNEATGLTSPRG